MRRTFFALLASLIISATAAAQGINNPGGGVTTVNGQSGTVTLNDTNVLGVTVSPTIGDAAAQMSCSFTSYYTTVAFTAGHIWDLPTTCAVNYQVQVSDSVSGGGISSGNPLTVRAGSQGDTGATILGGDTSTTKIMCGANELLTFTLISTSPNVWQVNGGAAIQAKGAATSNQWLTNIDGCGVQNTSQPAFTNISGTATVGQGGTGATTLTAHGHLYGEGTSAIVASAAPTNGQLPIGSTGADPVIATITAGSNITVTNGAGSITIAATGATSNIQTFASSGGTLCTIASPCTWTKTGSPNWVHIHMCAGGGGGGAGATTATDGAGGGGGGDCEDYDLRASDLSGTANVVVGAGGTAGVVGGAAAGTGGESCFGAASGCTGPLLSAFGGGPGNAGGVTAGGGGGAGGPISAGAIGTTTQGTVGIGGANSGLFSSSAGGNGTTTTGGNALASSFVKAGGGGAGGNGANSGGSGGQAPACGFTGTGGGSTGNTGSSPTSTLLLGGCGGGGGGGSTTGAAGVGGTGGLCGGGGGGGGSASGAGTAKNGGPGGDGCVVITSI